MSTAPKYDLVSTHCSACGRPLTDPVSAAAGLGPDCRADLGYVLEGKAFAIQYEANYLVHAIASNTYSMDSLKQAIFRLYELGFEALAKRIERRVGRRIAASYEQPPEPALAEAETNTIEPLPFALTEGQERAREAVQRLKQNRGYGVCVIAGYAGTGKTTMLRALAAEHGTPVVITPTGKAALRVREATGLHASTIHRWIYTAIQDEKTGTVRFKRREANDTQVPPSRLVLLDEASMVSPELWKDVNGLCKQLDLKLVLIGDGFQLPPVQPRNAPPFSVMLPAFAQQIGAERIELTEVLRQAQGSPVIRASMALRNGNGIRSLVELPRSDLSNLANTALWTHQNGGVTICHKNSTRYQLNAGMRGMLNIYDEMPQRGEPMMVLKNAYESGVVNGESFNFEGWTNSPEGYERVFDRYKPVEEDTRFGATTIGKATATISIEELHGRLTAGHGAISAAASKWVRMHNVFSGDKQASHVHVNFGYAWTAHKCVHPDTLIETPKGLHRISAVADDDDWTVATAGGARRFNQYVTTPKRKMLQVETRDGYSLDVTRDHGIYVWNGKTYARKEAKDIQPNDFVRLRLGATFDPKRIVPLEHAIRTGDVRERKYRLPRRLTGDVAELLGMIVADGVVARKVVRLAKRHRDVVERFATLFHRVFGRTLKIQRLKHAKAWMAECSSTQVAAWVQSFDGTSAHVKAVPAQILLSSLNIQARFLRGLFEDGSANTGRAKGDMVQWSNKSRAVAGTVQVMLLRFGIVANRSRHRTQTMLHIFGNNVLRFRTKIGFIAEFKRARLRNLQKTRDVKYVIPCDREQVWPLLTECEKNNLRASVRAHGRYTLTRDRASRIRKRVRFQTEPFAQWFDEAAGWHHTRVRSVRRIADSTAMCLVVPDGHRFLQNGMDGSNSQGSQWPYVFVIVEPSVRLDEEEGRRWTYTALTRASQTACVFIGRV